MATPAAPALSPDANVNQESLDQSLFQTLLIAAGAGILLTTAFLILRRCVPRLYAPSLFVETPKGKRMIRFWRWLKPMFTVSDDFLFEHRGLDTVMYAAFSRLMLILMIGFFFYGVLILWPVDGTSSNRYRTSSDPKQVEGTSILSMSNIDASSQKPRYTAHLLSVVFNSLLCYFFFIRTYNVYHRYTIRQWSRPDFANYTVMVDNVNRKLSEEEIKEVYDKHFPGEVLSVHRVYGTYKLHSMYRERCDIDELKSKAEWETDLSKRYSVYDDDHYGEVPHTHLNDDSDHEIDESDPKAAKKARKEKKKRDKKNKIEDPPPQMRDTDCCVTFACCCCTKPKVDVLDYAERRLTEYNTKMTKLEKKLKPTPSVFVTFRSRDIASTAAYTAFTCRRRRWRPLPAPDFEDIRWQSFEYSHRSRLARYLIILTICILLGLLFFIPVTFAQGLANISTLASIPGFNWIKPLSQRYKALTSAIEGILPSLVLAIAFALAKLFLKKVVLMERYFTRSNEFRSFTSKYFYMLFLNVFLASIIAGVVITMFQSAKSLFDTEGAVGLVRLLAIRLPTQVNFFINYMAVNAVIGNLIPLLQPVRLLTRFLCLKILGPKTWNRRNWLRQFNWFHYHEEYPVQLLYFSITIGYSSLAPIIIPFALILFSIKYLVGIYHSLYVFKRRIEGYGLTWPSVFNRLCAAVLLYQILMTGIFALNDFVAGIVVCAILFIITIIYAISVNRWYKEDLKQRCIEIDPAYRRQNHVIEDILSKHYRDPMRDWNIITYTPWQTSGVWFNTKDRLRQLQLSIDHPDYFRALQDQRLGYSQPTDLINTPEGLAAAIAALSEGDIETGHRTARDAENTVVAIETEDGALKPYDSSPETSSDSSSHSDVAEAKAKDEVPMTHIASDHVKQDTSSSDDESSSSSASSSSSDEE